MSYAATIEKLAAEHGRSPLHVLEMFLERAAIREFDGGMTRARAEEAAVEDCRSILGSAGAT